MSPGRRRRSPSWARRARWKSSTRTTRPRRARPSIARSSPTRISRPRAATWTTSSIRVTRGRGSSTRSPPLPPSETGIRRRSMAISLCSALLLVTLSQAPPLPVAPTDSLTTLRGRAARDSSDAQLWLLMGRAYLGLGMEAHGATHRSSEDSVWTRAVLDTAEEALGRAAALAGPLGSSAVGDSARVFRVGAWAARSWLGWEAGGVKAGVEAWGPLPMDLRVPPVLDELGENLLRACPAGGVLLTAGDADFYAAWYMRFARGLRPDLLVVPLAAWRSDPVLRARLVADLKLARHRGGGGGGGGGGGDDAWLGELARRRPVCVSMAFERPPETRPRVRWETRPLVWVTGPGGKGPRVPPRDFVFGALRVALDGNDPWAEPALAAYARAARATPALCEPMTTFNVASEVASCRR